jgi:hypothetical protein
MLDYIALFFIFFLVIVLAAVIVALGSLPGNIARKRGHPWPDAVNAASWIGLATGIFWPLAFIWAFLPVPVAGPSMQTDGPVANNDLASLQAKLTALEETVAKLRSQSGEGAS